MKKIKTYKVTHILLMAFMVSLMMGSTAFSAKSEDMSSADKVNINAASAKELAALPGIGMKKAEAIIAYRTENGNFSSVEDLRKVKGIGKKIFEKIKAHITVKGG